jgi:4-amino-4-deoxy-L-arabinose transferase-like glycosyltransferase
MKSLFRPILYSLLLYALFFAALGAIGFVGPDEPRYADVARAMHRTGDYVTPRLFGQPWFEKPPLYYWTAALLFAQGIDERTARLPSALAALLFLGFWYWFARRFYGSQAAQLSCLMLASAAGWIGFSRAAAMDMLLTVTLGAALVCLAVWFWEQRPAGLYGFYAWLGLATLAKGPLAVVLAGLVVIGYVLHSRRWQLLRGVLLTPAVAVFGVVAIPWYGLCYQRNGFAFVQEFFVRHNWERLVSGEAIGHSQAVWFYIPVVLAGLFPWTPMLVLPAAEMIRRGWRQSMEKPQRLFLFYWVLLPLAFFSLAENKLPGYVLPVLPPLTLWAASSLGSAEERGANQAPRDAAHASRLARYAMGASALLLLAVPWICVLLPEALAAGLGQALRDATPSSVWRSLTHGPVPYTVWITLAFLVAAALLLLRQRDLISSGGVVTSGVAWSVLVICYFLSPTINRVASVRSVAREVEASGILPEQLAAFHLGREQNYGLGFYLDRLPPEWSPDDPAQHASFVVARGDLRLEQLRPNALPLVLFPGQNARLWALELSAGARSVPMPASMPGN